MTNKILVEQQKKEITVKARHLLGYITRTELKDKLGITANTLRVRLELHNWTYEEVLIINSYKIK